MITDKIRPWELDEYQKEYLDSARQFMEGALEEKHIFVNDITVFDRFLIIIGQVYENLVTMQRHRKE